MKYFILFVVLALSSKIFAQSLKKLRIPGVKESLLIDSLIDQDSQIIEFPGKYIVIKLFPSDYKGHDVSFQFIENRSDTIYIPHINLLTDLSFFKYKGVIGLVSGLGDPCHSLFIKTQNFKTFKFLIDLHVKQKKHIKKRFRNDFEIFLYQYENCQFINPFQLPPNL